MDDTRIAGVIEAAYDSVLAADGWTRLLARLGDLFNSHFVDVFARTHDHALFGGLAHGLDTRDYEDEFLGIWVNRNVWGRRRPVRVAGEVVSTRQMLAKADLMHSEMYVDYLGPRSLHEGLRLAIWASDDWIQDISLLRDWSAGPFEAGEIALATTLLPHLQRAAAISRRIRAADRLANGALTALNAMREAAFLLDRRGRVLHTNPAADALVSRRDGLALGHGGFGRTGLCADDAAGQAELDATIFRAVQAPRDPASAIGRGGVSGTFKLARASGRPAAHHHRHAAVPQSWLRRR